MKSAKFTAGYEAAFRLVEGFLDLLEKRHMSRADLARKLEVKRSAVTRWFSPNRNLTIFTAAMIAEALGCELQFQFVERTAHAEPESVQELPSTQCEYRKVAEMHPAGEAAAVTASVSMPRQFGRGIETEAASREPIQLPAV